MFGKCQGGDEHYIKAGGRSREPNELLVYESTRQNPHSWKQWLERSFDILRSESTNPSMVVGVLS
jgi:hypothetical protein